MLQIILYLKKVKKKKNYNNMKTFKGCLIKLT